MIDIEHFYEEVQCGVYNLRQLETKEKVTLHICSYTGDVGWYSEELLEVVARRTKYLYSIIPCVESENAIRYVTQARSILIKAYGEDRIKNRMIKETVPGHRYHVFNSKTEFKEPGTNLVFLRRSGGAIKHPKEWPGLQTQELLRALIHWFTYGQIFPKVADLCRYALWEYEARAYRRKRQGQNRQSPEHELTVFPYSWVDIEKKSIGEDGHIPYLESEILYHANFGVCDAEPIPGVNPFTFGSDPVYVKAEDRLMKMGKK